MISLQVLAQSASSSITKFSLREKEKLALRVRIGLLTANRATAQILQSITNEEGSVLLGYVNFSLADDSTSATTIPIYARFNEVSIFSLSTDRFVGHV